MSQARLVSELGVSSGAVSRLVDDLEADGALTRRIARRTGARGRRAQLIDFDPQRGRAIGVSVEPSDATGERAAIRTTTLDYAGGRLEERRTDVTCRSPDELLAATRTAIASTSPDARAAVVIAVPATVAEQRATRAPNLPALTATDIIGSVPVQAIAHRLVNDADAAAVAELALGPYRSFGYLLIDVGVGAGLVVDGRLYPGASEPGHIFTRDHDGKRVTLERRLGIRFWLAREAERLGLPTDLEALATAHAGEDERARYLANVQAEALCDGAAILSGVLGLEAICVEMPCPAWQRVILGQAAARLTAEWSPMVLTAAHSGRDSRVLGAARHALALLDRHVSGAATGPA